MCEEVEMSEVFSEHSFFFFLREGGSNSITKLFVTHDLIFCVCEPRPTKMLTIVGEFYLFMYTYLFHQ